mgnify:CR=1 FL=1
MPVNQGAIPYFSQPSGARNTNVAQYELQARSRVASSALADAHKLSLTQEAKPQYTYVPRARGAIVVNTTVPSKASGSSGPRQYWG